MRGHGVDSVAVVRYPHSKAYHNDLSLSDVTLGGTPSLSFSAYQKKKKNVTAPESQSSQAGFLSPSSITRKNNTERTTPMTVS